MPRSKRRPKRIPEPKRMNIPDRNYQPGKTEVETEIDMPKLSLKKARAVFMRPFRFIHDPD